VRLVRMSAKTRNQGLRCDRSKTPIWLICLIFVLHLTGVCSAMLFNSRALEFSAPKTKAFGSICCETA
jgi:hypothetical protein